LMVVCSLDFKEREDGIFPPPSEADLESSPGGIGHKLYNTCE
jgi:hypothetical protein